MTEERLQEIEGWWSGPGPGVDNSIYADRVIPELITALREAWVQQEQTMVRVREDYDTIRKLSAENDGLGQHVVYGEEKWQALLARAEKAEAELADAQAAIRLLTGDQRHQHNRATEAEAELAQLKADRMGDADALSLYDDAVKKLAKAEAHIVKLERVTNRVAKWACSECGVGYDEEVNIHGEEPGDCCMEIRGALAALRQWREKRD